MHELDIELLCANSPQAKGRIERANQTLQDRLVKEMRLRHISNPEPGNAYLPEFMDDFNSRFAVPPRSSNNVHRPLTSREKLSHILAWQEPRLLSKNLALQFRKVVYQIQTKSSSYALRHAQVTVCEDAQAAVSILYQSRELPFTIFHKQERLAQIVNSKNVELPDSRQAASQARPRSSVAQSASILYPQASEQFLAPAVATSRGHLNFRIQGKFPIWVKGFYRHNAPLL